MEETDKTKGFKYAIGIFLWFVIALTWLAIFYTFIGETETFDLILIYIFLVISWFVMIYFLKEYFKSKNEDYFKGYE